MKRVLRALLCTVLASATAGLQARQPDRSFIWGDIAMIIIGNTITTCYWVEGSWNGCFDTKVSDSVREAVIEESQQADRVML